MTVKRWVVRRKSDGLYSFSAHEWTPDITLAGFFQDEHLAHLAVDKIKDVIPVLVTIEEMHPYNQQAHRDQVEAMAKPITPPGDGGLREALSTARRRMAQCHGTMVQEGLEESAMVLGWLYEIDVALGRPAEISMRDKEGGWHDTTPSPAEGQRIMATVKLCTCEIITGGQMVDNPACPFHHPPAPPAETQGSAKGWICTNCGMEVKDANVIAHPDLPTTIGLWHMNADGIWCGPVESEMPRKEGKGK